MERLFHREVGKLYINLPFDPSITALWIIFHDPKTVSAGGIVVDPWGVGRCASASLSWANSPGIHGCKSPPVICGRSHIRSRSERGASPVDAPRMRVFHSLMVLQRVIALQKHIEFRQDRDGGDSLHKTFTASTPSYSLLTCGALAKKHRETIKRLHRKPARHRLTIQAAP